MDCGSGPYWQHRRPRQRGHRPPQGLELTGGSLTDERWGGRPIAPF